MGCVEIEKTKEGHFTSENFNPRDETKRNDMDNTFVLGGNKKAHFLRPPDF